MKSAFFIPVYNQEQELPPLIQELKARNSADPYIFFINNGSTDNSRALIQSSGLDCIDLPRNKGIGHSFMVAFDWAIEHDYQILGVLAGNGKMLPAEIDRVLQPVLADEADYVTGSRYMSGGSSPNLPRFRQLAIPMVNHMVRLLYGQKLTDATCGFKAIKIDILKHTSFDWHHPRLDTYGFEYYLYGKVLLSKEVRWKEVAVTMRYPTSGKRYSKIKPFIGWFQMLKPWWLARFDQKRITWKRI
ncbi:MAG: glycosyltransferase family 2 protein [Verrucomicrobiota bacterium]